MVVSPAIYGRIFTIRALLASFRPALGGIPGYLVIRLSFLSHPNPTSEIYPNYSLNQIKLQNIVPRPALESIFSWRSRDYTGKAIAANYFFNLPEIPPNLEKNGKIPRKGKTGRIFECKLMYNLIILY